MSQIQFPSVCVPIFRVNRIDGDSALIVEGARRSLLACSSLSFRSSSPPAVPCLFFPLPLSLSPRLLSGVRFCCLEITSPTPARVWVSSFSEAIFEVNSPNVCVQVEGRTLRASKAIPCVRCSCLCVSCVGFAPCVGRSL